MMIKGICQALEKPPVYTKTKTAFWNDEYISKQMLKAHLDPGFEGASRKLDFIKKSAAWISRIVPPANYPFLLDVGCGPGIYAEMFADKGYQVTGIDFSKRSVNYAKGSAFRQGLDILYLYQDYLEMELNTVYDFATMIYCDYGALSAADRQTLMKKVYQHLKPGGKFLFDVFSIAKYNAFQEKQTWEISNSRGFWQEQAYTALTGCYKYPNHITLEQITVVSEDKFTGYYLWNTYFTKEMLIKEAVDAGFLVCRLFGDVTGQVYSNHNFTMAILLEK